MFNVFSVHSKLRITGEPIQWLDGGSFSIPTNKGVYFIDGRFDSQTKGMLFRGSPKRDRRNLVENPERLKDELIAACMSYKNSELWLPTLRSVLSR